VQGEVTGDDVQCFDQPRTGACHVGGVKRPCAEASGDLSRGRRLERVAGHPAVDKEADVGRGLLLLFFYSMGLAIPFLVAALAVEWFLTMFAKMKSQMVWIQRISGVMLIFVGLLMVTNYLSILSTWMQAYTPEFLRSRL